VKAFEDEDDGTLKKFSHKKDITKDLFYNVFCGDVAELSSKLPKKEYTLLVADIPYGFRMAGSSYDDEPFRFKQLEKMVKDFAELTTASLWRIVIFHSMDQGYSVAQALRSRCHGIENLAWYGFDSFSHCA
jgi:23S rRNA G2445 N2-methylase RlmL